MANEKCEWHAKGIWAEGLCYCSGCSCVLFEATALCREAMEFMAPGLGEDAEFNCVDDYLEAFEEEKRAEWRKTGGVGAEH